MASNTKNKLVRNCIPGSSTGCFHDSKSITTAAGSNPMANGMLWSKERVVKLSVITPATTCKIDLMSRLAFMAAYPYSSK